MRSTPTLMTMIAGKYLMDQWVVFDIEPLVVKTREIHGLLLAELGR